MPTRRGQATLAAALACFLVGRALGVTELYAVALAAAFSVVAAVASVRASRYRIAFVRKVVPAKTFPDETIRVDLAVRNAGRVSSPPLLVEDILPDALGGSIRCSVDSLIPAQSRVYTAERHALARGKFRIGPLRVKLIDPFGLAELSTTNRREDLVIVYPRIETFGHGVPPSQRIGTGPAHLMRLAPGGEEFYGIREYVHGDDLRKIHWASVAHTGDLMIRQDEARLHPRATILLDARATAHRGDGMHSSLEWGVSAAASVAWHLGRAGFSLRLATDSAGPGSPLGGKVAIENTLEFLAALESSRRGSLLPAVKRVATRPGAGGALVAILPPPNAEDLAALARLRGLYAWCGIMLIDPESFTEVAPRTRADADQRLANAEIALARSGWHVRTAGATDGIGDVWTGLLAGPASRRRSASSR